MTYLKPDPDCPSEAGLRDKGLLYAVGASIVAHGLVLALGSGLPRPVLEPRPIEARLLPRESAEAPAASRPAHPQPPAPQRVSPEPPRQVKTPPCSEAVAPRRSAWWRRARSRDTQRRAPVTTVHKADAAPAVITPAAPAPVASHPAAPPSYAPPSFGARYLDNPKPAYPMLARRRGLEGTVRLEVRVSAEGFRLRSRFGRAPVTRRSTRRR
jgi:protein TonB